MQGKVSPERSALKRVYVGIDVCKAWLDVYLHPIGQSLRVQNTAKGFKGLLRTLAKHQVALVVIEATGKYHRSVHRALHEAGIAVAVVNPLRSRLFAEAVGALAKTDRIDAKVLAMMAESLQPKAVAPLPAELENLQELRRARQAAVDDRTALSNQLGETKGAFLQRGLKRRLEQVSEFIARLEAEIQRLIDSDPELARRYAIVKSIRGIGPVAAVALIVGLAELGTCSAKQAAMLAGLAPIASDSGESKGARHIRGGREDVRRGIFMAAISAARCNPTLKPFYHRLIASGKLHKVAITAVMRKLVVLANTLLTENRHWQPEAPKTA
jgi:transposase